MPDLDHSAGTGTPGADTEHTRQIARLDAAAARLLASIARETPEPKAPERRRRRLFRR